MEVLALENSQIHFKWGFCFAMLHGDNQRAIRILIKHLFDDVLQAMDPDPTDATLPSNRSLCWLLLLHAEKALADAKTCRALRPDWANAFYREGAALQLLEPCFQLFFNIQPSFSLNQRYFF